MPRTLGRILIYTALILWTIIALFPIFWTFSTTFKVRIPLITYTLPAYFGGIPPAPHDMTILRLY